MATSARPCLACLACHAMGMSSLQSEVTSCAGRPTDSEQFTCKTHDVLEQRSSFWIILGSRNNDLGVISNRCGANRVSSWGRFGIVSVSCGYHVGIILLSSWDHLAIIVRPSWDHVGSSLDHFREHVQTFFTPKHVSPKSPVSAQTVGL